MQTPSIHRTTPPLWDRVPDRLVQVFQKIEDELRENSFRNMTAKPLAYTSSQHELPLDDLENLLWGFERLLPDHLTLQDGETTKLPPRRPNQKDLFRWTIDNFLDGYCLRITEVEDIESKVSKLCTEISQFLFAHVSAELMFSAPMSNSVLTSSQKVRSALVISLYGRPKFYASSVATDATLEFEQSYYVPEVKNLTICCAAEPCATLILWVTPLNEWDFLDCLIEVVMEDCVDLRTSNLASLSASDPRVREAITGLRETSKDYIIQEKAWGRMRMRLADANRALPNGHIRAFNTSSKVTLTTKVQVRPGAIFAFHEQEDGLFLYVPGLAGVSQREAQPGGVMFPTSAEPLLSFLKSQTKAVSAQDLPAGFSEQARLATIIRLLECGALQCLDDNGGETNDDL